MTTPLLGMNDMRQRYGSGGKLASRNTIYNMERTGDIPRSVRFGAKLFWKAADVVALENKRFAEAASQEVA